MVESVDKNGFRNRPRIRAAMNSSDSPFFALWGRKEPIYSRIIAQTLALSTDYRRGFLEMLAARFDGRDCKQTGQHLRAAAQCQNEEVIVRPEVVVGGGETPGGILDIYIEFPSNSFGLSIENKKHSELRPRQLLRYDGCLNNMPEKFVQVFLAPSGFRHLTAEEKPPTERFESVTYHDDDDHPDETSGTTLSFRERIFRSIGEPFR
jgi:hypothetical protein